MADQKKIQRPLLFVNKNAKNLGSRSDEEAFAIGSHVSGNYTKWEKVRRLRKELGNILGPYLAYHQEGPKALVWRVGPSPRAIANASEEHEKSNTSDTRHTTLKANSLILNGPLEARKTGQEDTKNSIRPSRTTEHHALESLQRAQPSPLSLVQRGNSDPFGAAALPITPLRSQLITIRANMYIDVVWPTEVSVAARKPALQAWRSEIRGIIGDEARMHAMFAVSLSSKSMRFPDSDTSSKEKTQALIHRDQAAKLIRRTILQNRRGLGSTLLQPIWQLAQAEFLAMNYQACLIHFKAVKNIIDDMGGINMLPWHTRKLLICWDLIISQALLKPLFFPVESWHPGSADSILSPVEKAELALSPHMVVPLDEEVPPSTVGLVRLWRELLAVRELAHGLQNEQRKTEILYWGQIRESALGALILSQRIHLSQAAAIEGDSRSPTAARRALESAASLTIEYCQDAIHSARSAEMTVLISLLHVKRMKESLLVGKSTMYPRLVLWILCFAAIAEEIIAERRGADYARWHSPRFIAMADSLGLWSWQQVLEVMMSFMYQRGILDRYLEALFEKADWLLGSEEDVDLHRWLPGLDLDGETSVENTLVCEYIL